jgi:hypothetical protein
MMTLGFRATKSALILLNALVSDAAAKTFAAPDSVDTDGDAVGGGGALGDTDGKAEALGVADADAVTVGVGVAVTVTAGVAVAVTVEVGVAEEVGDELVFTKLALQPVAIMATQATRARPYRSRAGEHMTMGTTSFLPFSLRSTVRTGAR